MAVPENNVDKTAQLSKFYLTLWQRGDSFFFFFFLLYMIPSFKFEAAILKIIYNMASSNNNLTLKVTDRMILPLA